MAYESAYWLAQDGTFLLKARMAIIACAIDIAAENDATPAHDARVVHAQYVLLNQAQAAADMAFGIALDPLSAGISGASPDSDFYNAAAAIWNAYAGVP